MIPLQLSHKNTLDFLEQDFVNRPTVRDFFDRRSHDAGILGVFQGELEKYGGNVPPFGYVNNFQTSPK